MRGNRTRSYGPRTVVLEPPTGKAPRLPGNAPGGGDWSAGTKRTWKLWFKHPASSMWGPEMDAVYALISLVERFETTDNDRVASLLAAQIRLGRDSLGLTARGMRERGWELPSGEQQLPKTRKAQPKPVLKVVAPADDDFDQVYDPEAA